MEDNGNVNEQYDIGNSASSWDGFRARYAAADTEIALEVSTTGKYVARKLRDMGFRTHMADPSTLALIFRTAKKNDREDSYMYWIRSDSDSMSMEKHLYRGRVKGGGVFNLLPIPEVTIW